MTFALHTTSVLTTLGYDAGVFPTGAPPETTTLGFDLDDTCTCQLGAKSANSCATKTAQCDLDGGVDNQLPKVLDLVTAAQPNANDALGTNTAIMGGDRTLLVTIRGYNGLANDPSVTVVIRAAARPDLAPAPSCEAGAPIRPPAFMDMGSPDSGIIYDPDRTPLWDGCDRWGVLESTPPLAAYVTNHRLVVVASGATPMPIAGGSVELESARLVAVLSPRSDGTFTLEDGVFAGRAPTGSLLAQLARLRLGADAGPICAASAAVQALLVGQVCGSVDTLANAAQDGLGSACDAISVAQGFRADPAFAGDPVDAGAGPCDGVMIPSCQ